MYNGKKIPFFIKEGLLGTTSEKMLERSVELALAKEWLKEHPTNVIEIGAVTPYYMPRKVKDIVDPTDLHKLVNYHISMFDMDLTGKNVLSISTVEHIGTGDYGFQENTNAVKAIKKIIRESNSCLITYPIGWNPYLDEWTLKQNSKRIKVYASGKLDNHWVERKDKSVFKMKYHRWELGGSAIVIIEK